MNQISDSTKRYELESALFLSESKVCYKRIGISTGRAKAQWFNRCVNLAQMAEQRFMDMKDNERLFKVYEFLYRVYQKNDQEDAARSYLNKVNKLKQQYGRVLYW